MMYLSGNDESQEIIEEVRFRAAPYLSTGLSYGKKALQNAAASAENLEARLAAKDGDLEEAIKQGFEDAKKIQSSDDLWNLLKLLAGAYVIKRVFFS